MGSAFTNGVRLISVRLEEEGRSRLGLTHLSACDFWLTKKRRLLGGVYESVVTPPHQSSHLEN